MFSLHFTAIPCVCPAFHCGAPFLGWLPFSALKRCLSSCVLCLSVRSPCLTVPEQAMPFFPFGTVVAADGNTYERAEIERWLRNTHHVSAHGGQVPGA